MNRLGRAVPITIGLIAGAAFGRAPVMAQLKPQAPTGSRIMRNPDEARLEETRRIMADFARCTVKRHRAEAVSYVLDPARHTPDERPKKLADSYCLINLTILKNADVALVLPGDMMRYAIADVLLAEEFPSFSPNLIENAAPLNHPQPNPSDFTPKPGKRYTPEQLQRIAEARVRALVRVAFAQYGECVVRTDPVGSHALINSKASSPQEFGAIQALMPAFAECLPEGQQFKSNAAMLRGVVAVNFYRLAHAPKALPAAGVQK
jgi:hypothetical protein